MLLSPADRCSTTEVERQLRIVDCMLSATEGLSVKIHVEDFKQLSLALSVPEASFWQICIAFEGTVRKYLTQSVSHGICYAPGKTHGFLICSWGGHGLKLPWCYLNGFCSFSQCNEMLTKVWILIVRLSLFFLKLYQLTENNPRVTEFLLSRVNVRSRDQVKEQNLLICCNEKAYRLLICLKLWYRPCSTFPSNSIYGRSLQQLEEKTKFQLLLLAYVFAVFRFCEREIVVSTHFSLQSCLHALQ